MLSADTRRVPLDVPLRVHGAVRNHVDVRNLVTVPHCHTIKMSGLLRSSVACELYISFTYTVVREYINITKNGMDLY